MDEINTRRIVLFGKTGSGKSSLANTIFGEKDKFKVYNSPNSGTKFCESEIKNINGTNIQLIDTPGLFDTDPESSELSPAFLECITECAPGPHAFLLMLKIEKFTKQEQIVVEIILKYFSKEALKYTTVVFTRGDDLPDEMKIEDWVNQNDALRDLLQKCGGRCHVFDNRHWNNSQDEYRNNQNQVKELLETIEKTVRENRGGYYTNETLQTVQREIEKEEEHIRKSSLNFSQAEITSMAKKEVSSKLKKIMFGVSVGIILIGFFCVGGVALIVIGEGLAFAIGGVIVLTAGVAGTVAAAAAAAVKGAKTAAAAGFASTLQNDIKENVISLLESIKLLFKKLKQ